MFPLFSERFLAPVTRSTSSPAVLTNDNIANSLPVAPRIGSLRALDLRTLPRDDGPPTELRTRKEKLAHFEKECTHVGDQLYVGAEVVAKSRQILQSAGITHIVNCVGMLYPQYFENEVKYQTLYLNDSPHEDILCVLYDVFDFIEAAKAESGDDGRVLIHCSQGISRSASLAIAYLMLKSHKAYETVFNEVKTKRGVANPNIGFTCQLIQWHRRLTEEAHKERLYRIVPQSTSAPQYLVPKLCSSTKHAALDPRGAFVLHTPTKLFVWVGAQCPEPFSTAAQRFASQLQRYEDAPKNIRIEQGRETDDFWDTLDGGKGGADNNATTFQNKSYDGDYLVYSRSIGPSMCPQGDTCDSARSGRKTPRSYANDAAHSPNDRLRKQARSEAGLERSSSLRSAGEQQQQSPTVNNNNNAPDSARAALSFPTTEADNDPTTLLTSRRTSLTSLPPLERTSSQPSPRPSPRRSSSDCELPPLAPRGDRPVLRRPGLPPLNLKQLQPGSPRLGVSPRMMPSPRIPPTLSGLNPNNNNNGSRGGIGGVGVGGISSPTLSDTSTESPASARAYHAAAASAGNEGASNVGGVDAAGASGSGKPKVGGSRLGGGGRPVPKINLPPRK